MVTRNDKWIRIFDISDISKHRKGFTLYKVISMLYPESCPDAVTKLTVWKRFNDFKKLHRELKVLHRKLNLKDKYPNLPGATFFKRFNEDTIQNRRQSILIFLEYVASNHQLFTSSEFVKFFETSHTPLEQLTSNISAIRADLNLPEDLEYYNCNSDDEHTISDTDSITTLNSIQTTSQNSVCLSEIDNQINPTPPNTPSSTMLDYENDSSLHVNIANGLENEKKYEEAFTAYVAAVEILLKYGKEEKNYDKKQMIRYKTEKCLIKAEKIYNMYLAPELKNLKEIECSKTNEEEQLVQHPISDLYKYKIVRVIGSGMLVLHSEQQQLYFIKVVHKTVNFLEANLILPDNVPYMVKLYNCYSCENAIFLILEYCSGKKLLEFLSQQQQQLQSENTDEVFLTNEELLKQVQELEPSDEESEPSYSDLINEYTSNKGRINIPSRKSDSSGDDYGFEKINSDDLLNRNKNRTTRNLMDEPVPVLVKNESKNDEFPNGKSLAHLRTIIKWAAQLLLALEKLHSLGVICRDIQFKHLLINDAGDLKLTYQCNVQDFFDVIKDKSCLAPENYSFQEITRAADWWCFGVILYELLVGMPFADVHPNGVDNFTVLKIPKFVSAEGRSLLKQLLAFDPDERLGSGLNGTENLKSHPFFHSVQWGAYS